MIQANCSQQPKQQYTLDEDLHISICNINQIMEKINQAVKKSQSSLNFDPLNTFVTQENLITENTDNDDSDFLNQLKHKVNCMKIPLHQLHKKNKLSTVIEESQSQSGRTIQNTVTPRQPDLFHHSNSIQKKILGLSFHKKSLTPQKLSIEQIQTDDEYKKLKKITGIRKTSCFNHEMEKQKKIEVQQKQGRDRSELQKSQGKKSSFHRYSKTQSITNLKCTKILQNIFSHKKINDQIVEDESQKRQSSRSKKGLSLMSKRSLKSQQNQKILMNIQNRQNKSKTCYSALSSQKKNSSCKNSITIKRRTINPFLMPKKSLQLEKKNQNKEPKTKNCLSRTNIRDFFVSKRINK